MTINKLHVHKIITVGIIFCCLIICIALRLLYLQVLQEDQLTAQSINNCTRLRSIQLPRGNIVDCHGQLIATNRPVINIVWQGTGNRQLSEQQRQLLATVEQLTGKSLIELMPTIARAEKLAFTVYIASDISFAVLTKIVEGIGHYPNIGIKSHFERFYPYGDLASHLIGYLGKCDLDLIGKMGVEKLSHQELKGIEGVQQALINAVGKELAASIIQKGESGKTIQTTIDLQLQQLAQAVFDEELTGTLILMDSQTGALRALLSRPTFNPALFLHPIEQRSWSQLQQGKPFVNRAVHACYPPASLFKAVTLSAALELGIVHPTTITCCAGFTTFAGRRYHCKRHEGHGSLTIKEAFAHSCNILFFEIGKRIAIDTLAEYASRFGLGKPTGIAFDEKIGLVPTNAWKVRYKGERWWPGETLSAVIGQSYLLTTPMQIARMYSGLYSGVLPTPRILEQEEITTEPLLIQESTRKFLLQLMKAVIQQGSGIRMSKLKDITLYAKTGTAQTSALNKQHLGRQFVEHGWFVSMFQYKNEQPLTMVVLVEHIGSSSVAAGITKQFLLGYKKLVDQQHEVVAQQ